MPQIYKAFVKKFLNIYFYSILTAIFDISGIRMPDSAELVVLYARIPDSESGVRGSSVPCFNTTVQLDPTYGNVGFILAIPH